MKNDELAPEDEEEDEDFKDIGLSLPKMSINIRSSDQWKWLLQRHV